MAERIVFPDVPPRPNFKRRCIEFPAELGAKKLLCLATAELLVERFEARDFTEEEILRAYEKYRPRLQAIARSQIRAGKISPNFEVLLTTESFALKEVKFSDGVRESPYYFQLARQVTAELEEVVKTSAPFVTVEWDRTEDTEGRVFYVFVIRDFAAGASVAFTPDQLERFRRDIRSRLYRLWGNLLEDRNHKQLQDLLGVRQPED